MLLQDTYLEMAFIVNSIPCRLSDVIDSMFNYYCNGVAFYYVLKIITNSGKNL